MTKRPTHSQVLFRNDQSTPIGRLSLAGVLHKADRTQFPSMRILGSYAIVYLTHGSGFYSDVNGIKRELCAGDLILVFPEIAHHYGPRRGEQWSEIYVVFDGPAFDLWREKGILKSAHPVFHLGAVEQWLPRIESTLAAAQGQAPQETATHVQAVSAFLDLLTQMLAPQSAIESAPVEEKWLAHARRLLDGNLSMPLDMREVAREVGLSYESFRKRFAKAVGVSPARYRMERRIAAAQILLTQSNLTLRAVATNLGFSDEFHFSRRFKEITGTTPRSYRLSTAIS